MITVNYYAIIVAALASMIIGMLWYSPGMFGRQWMKLVKITPKKMKQQANAKSYIIAILAALLTATILSLLAPMFPRTPWGGVVLGFIAWAGFVATTSINQVIWEGKPPLLFFINNANQLLSLVIMGIIVSVWV